MEKIVTIIDNKIQITQGQLFMLSSQQNGTTSVRHIHTLQQQMDMSLPFGKPTVTDIKSGYILNPINSWLRICLMRISQQKKVNMHKVWTMTRFVITEQFVDVGKGKWKNQTMKGSCIVWVYKWFSKRVSTILAITILALWTLMEATVGEWSGELTVINRIPWSDYSIKAATIFPIDFSQLKKLASAQL